MAKIESGDPNELTIIIKAASAQAVDILQVQDSTGAELMSVDKDGVPSGWGSGTGTGDVVGPSSATDNAVTRFDTTTGKKVQNSLMTVTDAGSPNIPTGQTYKINSVSLAYGDVGAAASAHNQSATTITTGTLDGDRLPAMSTSKQGAVPLTGTPSGNYLKDDATWDSPLGTAGDVFGPSGATDSAVALFDTATGKLLKNSLVTVDGSGSVDIPSGQTYNIDSTPLSYSDVGAPALVHTHDGSDIVTGIDGDILPTMSETKAGGVPATGTPVGKYLEDDGTWSSPAGAGDVMGPGTSTNLAIPKFDGTGGDTLLDTGVTIDASNNLNIPSGSVYQIDGTNLTFTDVGAAEASHEHAGEDITSGTIDGDMLPTMSETKSGAVPPTGTPTGLYLTDEGTWESPPGGGDVTGPGASTDNAVARFDLTSGKTLQNSVMTVSDAGTVNIPTGQTYNIAGNPLDYSDVGAAAPTHDQAASTITTGTLDGDRLPALSTTKKGGVPATGTPSGLYLNDGGTWTAPSGGSGCKSHADYVVYKSGSTYYAQNGSTYAIDYSNTSFKTLMDNLYGKVVHLRSGTYTLSVELDMGDSPDWENTVIKGAGEKNTIIMNTGNHIAFHVRANNIYITDLTIDSSAGGAASVGIKVGPDPGENGSAYMCHFENLEIMDFSNYSAAAMRFADQWYYISVINVRMMTYNGCAVDFCQKSGATGDNGQTCFIDCEMSGMYNAVARSQKNSTCHRITFIRCGFMDAHDGDYIFDALGIHELLLLNCDFETNSSAYPAVSILRTGGDGQVFDACLFYARNKTTCVGVVSASSYGHTGVVFTGCNFDYWGAGEVAFASDDPTLVLNPGEKSFNGTMVGGAGINIINVDSPYGGTTSILRSFFNCTYAGIGTRYVSSAAASPPTLATNGEVVVWHDSMNNKEYLMIRSNGVTKKVECT